ATHVFLVPAVVSALLAAGDKAITALSGLKYLLYGAAPMPLAMLRQTLAAWPGLNFVQVYGQTELAGVISALSPRAHRDASRPGRLLSAGTLLPGAEVRVVDPATGQDVTVGQPAEFWFRSAQRMMGYLNKPADTAEAITEEGHDHHRRGERLFTRGRAGRGRAPPWPRSRSSAFPTTGGARP